MLKFREYLKEEASTSSVVGNGAIAGKDIPLADRVPNAHLVKRRHRYQLPQINDISEMKNDLRKNDIPVVMEKIHTHALVPSQLKFDNSKVTAMANTKNAHNDIVVSQDLKIIDGHHRFAANFLNNTYSGILRIGLTFDDAMKFFRNKPYIKNGE